MSVNREELEQMALEAAGPDLYYELIDALEETPDEDLWDIVCNQ